MKIGPDSQRASAICGSNSETIVVRGYDLTELVGNISFTDHIWLLLTGRMPTDTQRAVLDATLVCIAEHGLVPNVQAARLTFAAAPEALQGAVAAGLLGCGSVVFGASQLAGEFLTAVVERSGAIGLDAAASELVEDCTSSGRPVPGYGHPLHKSGDPRVHRLIAVAREAGATAIHVEAARAVERAIPVVIGKSLVLNVSGAMPAVLLDVGYPLLALKGVPLIGRTASLLAHLLEEQLRPIGFLISHAGAAAVRYDGPAPEGFIADEN